MDIYNQKYTLAMLIKLIYLIDFKDGYMKEHSENVTKYSLLLASNLGLSKNDLEIIGIGAMLHDIGKLGIADYLLVKETSLNDKEYEMIKRHVTVGEALLPNDSFYDEIKK